MVDDQGILNTLIATAADKRSNAAVQAGSQAVQCCSRKGIQQHHFTLRAYAEHTAAISCKRSIPYS
jgi:hypothetical protein